MKTRTARKPAASPSTRSAVSKSASPRKAPVALDRAQRALVAEALRRAEAARNVIEDALVDFGRWALVHVFADDAAAVFGNKRANPVWRGLLARAGGPSLRLSRKTLYVAVAIAAHDKRITDESWRLLEPGRKEILLPLGDGDALRQAAQHVVAMKLTQRDTRAYVKAALLERGGGASRVTVPRFRAQLRTLRSRVMRGDYTRKLKRQLAALAGDDGAAVRGELLAMRRWLDGLIEAQGA